MIEAVGSVVVGSIRTLKENEAIIDGWLDDSFKAAAAWKEIRDGKQYLDQGYTDFDTYSRERWGKRRSQIDDAIRWHAVAERVTEISVTDISMKVSHARELSLIPEDRRVGVWQEAVETHGEKVTAAAIREIAQRGDIVDMDTGEIVGGWGPEDEEEDESEDAEETSVDPVFAKLHRQAIEASRAVCEAGDAVETRLYTLKGEHGGYAEDFAIRTEWARCREAALRIVRAVDGATTGADGERGGVLGAHAGRR